MVLGGMETSDNPTVLQWFANEGIGAERLQFHPVSDMPTYLKLHHQVDICLDTFPYSGGTTTWHAVWMGVPTLTLSGKTPVSRTGCSILGHVGIHSFQANSPQEFINISLAWADQLDELARVRASLRERFAPPQDSPPVIGRASKKPSAPCGNAGAKACRQSRFPLIKPPSPTRPIHTPGHETMLASSPPAAPILLPCLLATLCTLGACSTEAWYEGAKRSAENQCRQQPPGAVEECLARVNKSRYDTYEKERTAPR
ncbi:MAG: hypothetical protein IPN06_12775 [Burkholderiales bacterium]|nr:hypothetical protein [Burkholderiales bacterium]